MRHEVPFCGFENDKVVDSRESKEADSIRRRRECLKCGKRFTTYERIEKSLHGGEEGRTAREFDRQKVLRWTAAGLREAPVPISRLEQIVNEAEAFVIDSAERERRTSEVGELIMNRLRRYDKVAYVRFASVYLDFKDVQEFMTELKDLLKTKEPAGFAKVQLRVSGLVCRGRLALKPNIKSKTAGESPATTRMNRVWLTRSPSSPATASALK